ncbi:MAG TPA: A24 family peptidase [Solirubrobacteraceae bacterium]|nr:A24 family peptidase [Solirubrobacteraceae bacterium]
MSTVEVALAAVLVVTGAIATVTDLRERRIPNWLTGAAALVAIALGLALDASGEPGRLAAGAGAAAFFGVAALLNPAGMGFGDVKLAGVLGLCLGDEVIVALLAALAAGNAVVLSRFVRHGRAARGSTLPFGPCLALGGVAGVVAQAL